jgi:hypothetical protein
VAGIAFVPWNPALAVTKVPHACSKAVQLGSLSPPQVPKPVPLRLELGARLATANGVD